jgi:hypothetical protein
MPVAVSSVSVSERHMNRTSQELQVLARADCLHREHCTRLVSIFVREATVRIEDCRSLHCAMAILATAMQAFCIQGKAVLKPAWANVTRVSSLSNFIEQSCLQNAQHERMGHQEQQLNYTQFIRLRSKMHIDQIQSCVLQ